MRKRYAVGVISPESGDLGGYRGTPSPSRRKLWPAPRRVKQPSTKGVTAKHCQVDSAKTDAGRAAARFISANTYTETGSTGRWPCTKRPCSARHRALRRVESRTCPRGGCQGGCDVPSPSRHAIGRGQESSETAHGGADPSLCRSGAGCDGGVRCRPRAAFDRACRFRRPRRFPIVNPGRH